MRILVTGSNGFIGKHLCLALERKGYEVLRYDLKNEADLEKIVLEADFIVHLAGINRPRSNEAFYEGNTNFTKTVVDFVKNNHRLTPILFASSIQAELDNDYGRSKKLAEEILFQSGLPVYIYRLNNVFGKWCRPNYNSVVATFCHNIAHDLPIEVRDPDYVVSYVYIDDVVDAFLGEIEQKQYHGSHEFLSVNPIHECSLGHLEELLRYFKKEIESERHLPILHDEFELKLFKTFCDYLSDEEFSLNFASDERGSFQELYKSKRWGQISENVAFPGIIKGGHYHIYKKEIFYTVLGECLIKQTSIHGDSSLEDIVQGSKPSFINILPNYLHTIENIGDTNSHTLMWVSEPYDESRSDTYRL